MTTALEVPEWTSERMLFRVGSHTLAIDVRDAAAASLLECSYSVARCAPAARPADCVAVLNRLGGGKLQARFGRHPIAAEPSASGTSGMRAIYHAAREIFARCASAQPGTLAFYGVLAHVAHGSVLLLGPTAIGKSLTALHLSELGAKFLGDETALLSLSTGEISALPRRPSLRESALEFLPAALRPRIEGATACFQTERGRFWYGLQPAEIGVEPSARSSSLRAVCVLRGRSDRFSARRLDLHEALPAIVQRAYARPSDLAQTTRLRHALSGAACYDVTLGSPAESAQQLMEELAKCA